MSEVKIGLWSDALTYEAVKDWDTKYLSNSVFHLFEDIEQLKRKNAELEKDIAFYRCCALSGETPDDLCKPSSIALQEKALRGE